MAEQSLNKEIVKIEQFYYIDGVKNQIVSIITDIKNNAFILPKRAITDLANKIATVKDKAPAKGGGFKHCFQDDTDPQSFLVKAFQRNNTLPESTATFQYAIVNIEKKVILHQRTFKINFDNNKISKGELESEFGILVKFETILEISERLSFNFSNTSPSLNGLFDVNDSLFE